MKNIPTLLAGLAITMAPAAIYCRSIELLAIGVAMAIGALAVEEVQKRLSA